MPPKASADFKKIKAKVGKRAPKLLNLTETSFRAASLSLREQAVQIEKHDDALISSRGRSVSELSTQLQHPARAVRISAAKGLRDIITHIKDTSSVRQNVSIWVSICSKCLVDEEDEVRALSLSMLKHLLLQLANSNELIPLSGLIIAFCSSALNSLDKSSRRDGAEAVALLSRYAPNVVRPYISSKLLPAFVRILADYRVSSQRTLQQTGDSSKLPKKRKRNNATSQSAASGRQSIILEALLLLLEASVVNGDDEEYVSIPKRYRVSSEQMSSGAVFVPKSNVRHKVSSVTSFRALIVSPVDGGEVFETSNEQHLPLNIAKDVIVKLRDKFVEVTQKGYIFNDEAYRMSWEDLQIVYQLLRCINLFWITYGSSVALALDAGGQEADRFKKQCGQLLHLMLEFFPLYDDGSPNSNAKDANFETCSTVLCICTKLRRVWGDHKLCTWIKPVTTFVHNQLETRLKKVDPKSEGPSSVDVLSASTIQVLSLLLLNGEKLWREGKAVFTHLRTLFYSVFFGGKESFNESTARSKVGRTAAILAIALIEQNYDCSADETEMILPADSSKTIEILPLFLIAWKGDFEKESFSVLSLLLRATQQTCNPVTTLLPSIRQALEPLFVGPRTTEKTSIFEGMSPNVQHLVISLIVSLGSPTDITIKGLANSCAQCHRKVEGLSLSSEIASFIVWSMHGLRKTIRMQSYICFLIDSTGLMEIRNDGWWDDSKPGSVVTSEKLQALDAALADILTCLVQCGSKKVLPTLHTLLDRLMGSDEAFCRTSQAVWIRAAMCILAAFSMDISRDDSSVTLTRLLPIEMVELLVAALTKFFVYSRQQQLTRTGSWMKPVFTILSLENEIFKAFFHAQFASLSAKDSTEQANTIDMIYNSLQNDIIQTQVHEEADYLSEMLRAVCQSIDDSKLEKRSQTLMNHLQSIRSLKGS